MSESEYIIKGLRALLEAKGCDTAMIVWFLKVRWREDYGAVSPFHPLERKQNETPTREGTSVPPCR